MTPFTDAGEQGFEGMLKLACLHFTSIVVELLQEQSVFHYLAVEPRRDAILKLSEGISDFLIQGDDSENARLAVMTRLRDILFETELLTPNPSREHSEHYQKVWRFMMLAKQASSTLTPQIPTEAVRLLRVRLTLEEVLEKIHGFGFAVYAKESGEIYSVKDVDFVASDEPDLVEILDGCADVAVVNTGDLIACGFPDSELMALVDENNLAKFGPGHKIDEHGKLIKPPGHKKPDINELIQRITLRYCEQQSGCDFLRAVISKIGPYKESELMLGGGIPMTSLPFNAPWMTPFGIGEVNITDLRRDDDGRVMFQLADQDNVPYKNGTVWYHASAFPHDYPA